MDKKIMLALALFTIPTVMALSIPGSQFVTVTAKGDGVATVSGVDGLSMAMDSGYFSVHRYTCSESNKDSGTIDVTIQGVNSANDRVLVRVIGRVSICDTVSSSSVFCSGLGRVQVIQGDEYTAYNTGIQFTADGTHASLTAGGVSLTGMDVSRFYYNAM